MTRAGRAPIAVVIGAVVVALSACAVNPQPAGQVRVWRTDGYGWVYEQDGDQLDVYETTAISCLRGATLKRTDVEAADGTLRFGERDATTQTIHLNADGSATAHLMGTAADMDLIPLPSLPPLCSQKVPQDPRTVFDIFWSTFAENYNSFGRKHIDWSRVRDEYRPKVSASTSDTRLFTILKQMIEPLHDAHTSISSNGDDFSGERVGSQYISGKNARAATDAHLQQIGARGLTRYANDNITYADLPDGRGYLRIDTFEGYNSKDDSSVASAAELSRTLDSIFTSDKVSALRGLVIDVRLNSGGDDALGLQIAARLTDHPYAAYTKAARNDPRDITKHGRARTVMVTPADTPRYTGSIWILTSDSTISAGETFVEAMMGRSPTPARIGTATQGVFADDMTRKLPNGWTFTLGNEDYVGPDGHNYEGTGIPPTLPHPVFTDAELAGGRDDVLDLAH